MENREIDLSKDSASPPASSTLNAEVVSHGDVDQDVSSNLLFSRFWFWLDTKENAEKESLKVTDKTKSENDVM
jgi:hypothetical protein